MIRLKKGYKYATKDGAVFIVLGAFMDPLYPFIAKGPNGELHSFTEAGVFDRNNRNGPHNLTRSINDGKVIKQRRVRG